MPRHRSVHAALCSLIALGSTPATAATCAPAQANPEAAVRQMYAAIAAGDRAQTIAAFTEDAYLFDGGKRFTPAGITDTILQAEAAGLKPRWTVETPDSHVACDLAWTTWTIMAASPPRPAWSQSCGWNRRFWFGRTGAGKSGSFIRRR